MSSRLSVLGILLRNSQLPTERHLQSFRRGCQTQMLGALETPLKLEPAAVGTCMKTSYNRPCGLPRHMVLGKRFEFF